LKKLFESSNPHGSDSYIDDFDLIIPHDEDKKFIAESIFFLRSPKLLPNNNIELFNFQFFSKLLKKTVLLYRVKINFSKFGIKIELIKNKKLKI